MKLGTVSISSCEGLGSPQGHNKPDLIRHCRPPRHTGRSKRVSGSTYRGNYAYPEIIEQNSSGIPLFIEIPLLSPTRAQVLALASLDCDTDGDDVAPTLEDDASFHCKDRDRPVSPRIAKDRARTCIRRSFTPPVLPTLNFRNDATPKIQVGKQQMFLLSAHISSDVKRDASPRLVKRDMSNTRL